MFPALLSCPLSELKKGSGLRGERPARHHSDRRPLCGFRLAASEAPGVPATFDLERPPLVRALQIKAQRSETALRGGLAGLQLPVQGIPAFAFSGQLMSDAAFPSGDHVCLEECPLKWRLMEHMCGGFSSAQMWLQNNVLVLMKSRFKAAPR